QSTPGAAPASSPAGGAVPLTPRATATTSPMAPSAGADPSDLAEVMPYPFRPATLVTSNAGLLDAGSGAARTLESGSPANAEISPIAWADTRSGRRLNVLLALADGDTIDDGLTDWLVFPVTLSGEVN